MISSSNLFVINAVFHQELLQGRGLGLGQIELQPEQIHLFPGIYRLRTGNIDRGGRPDGGRRSALGGFFGVPEGLLIPQGRPDVQGLHIAGPHSGGELRLYRVQDQQAGSKAIKVSSAEPLVYLFGGILGIILLYNWRIFG